MIPTNEGISFWFCAQTQKNNIFSLSPLKESSVEGVSAWSWSEEREQFYLHNFFDFVPDLNLRNDIVREKMKVGEMYVV